MNIILIGYRGTGKSSVGRGLAERLQRPFYDTDDLVEAADGRSIREVVAERGWPFFRQMEKKIIHDLAGRPEGVVATGGGAVMDEGNADTLKKTGILIWLVADAETIVERIHSDSRSPEKRPALTDKDALRETEDILKKRTPVYRRLADFSVDTEGKSVTDIANEICRFLKETNRVVMKGETCREIP
jgi:shikimate kinase